MPGFLLVEADLFDASEVSDLKRLDWNTDPVLLVLLVVARLGGMTKKLFMFLFDDLTGVVLEGEEDGEPPVVSF